MTEQIRSSVPSLRFRGYDSFWKETQLGTVCSVGDADHWMPESIDNGIPYVMTGDFCGIDEINFEKSKKISEDDYEKLSRRIRPELGDILFARYASIGLVRLVATNKKFIASYSCAILKVNKKFNSKHVFFSLQSNKIKNQLARLTNTGSQGNVGLDSLKQLQVKVPTRAEQEKISTYFSELNQLIKLSKSKHDKLVTLKKAMLGKMLPQPGATVPEIRFKGFAGDWVEKKLDDICEIVGGGTPNTLIPEYWNGDIDWYSPTEIGEEVYASGSTKKITLLGLSKSSARILPPNNTILFTSRAGIGDMAILAKKGCTNQGFQSLVLNNKIDSYFIYSMGHLIKTYALKNASGSTFLEISGKQLGKMKILLPNKDEQKKIGTYFRTLDNLISKHAIHLKKLQQIKSACLEKMFA